MKLTLNLLGEDRDEFVVEYVVINSIPVEKSVEVPDSLKRTLMAIKENRIPDATAYNSDG